MVDEVIYEMNLKHVDWQKMKSTLSSDAFDNGRTASQLQKSFENSYATVIAYANAQIIGTARVLSDSVCNAYIVHVWMLTQYHKRGITSAMMKLISAKLEGQHVYLFTDDSVEFYEKLGFEEQSIGLGKAIGQWLRN